MVKLKHLKKRSVINVYNGNFIGYITDIYISFPEGKIESLIVQPPLLKRIINSLFYNNKTIVNWNNIVSIGKDVILVNIIDN